MNIVKDATCGTMESSDAMVVVSKGDGGLELELESPVLKLFGKQIKAVVLDCCSRLNVENAHIQIIDKGALDCTIKARTETALFRAAESVAYRWEVNNGN